MIITIADLVEVRARHADDKLVLTSGTFDLLHTGHLSYLEQVKQHGDVVAVLLSGDDRVKARKGSSRPIIPEGDRARMLDALGIVDYVLIDPSKLDPADTDPIHADIIDRLKPDYYVTDGPDPRFIDLLDRSKFIILERAAGGKHASTSAIVNHIVKVCGS